MAIVQNPQFDPASGYRPVEWISQTIENIANGEIKIATAIVTLDGTQVATIKKRPYIRLGFGPVFTYGFKWDVQAIFQRLKAPKAQSKTLAFGAIGAQYNADASDCYGELELELEYFYEDASTGLLVSQGFTEFTTDWPVFIATRQHEQNMNLLSYVPDAGSLLPSKWLTNAPLNQTICLEDSLFLNTIHGDANFLRVQTFDSVGAVIDTGYLAFPASGFDSQVALGVGPNEIRNTTFTSGSVNIDNTSVASYQVTVGQGNAPFIALSETYTFTLQDCCLDDFERLHFLNRLGGTDAFTFKSLNVRSQTTTSEVAQKPLDWNSDTSQPHRLNDRGAFKLDSRAVISRQLETPPLEPNFADWLAELLSSPEVYWERSNGLVPVVIEDTEQEIETNTDTELALFSFSIVAKDANERIIQRN
jgi:hypothetical protein